jgi:para-aminobenzoate synthetase component 1
MEHHTLPYLHDAAQLFRGLRAAFADAVWLDSAAGVAGGRYDVMAADPVSRLRARGGKVRVESVNGASWETERDPLEVLQELLDRRILPTGLPFSGGAIGYFGYDLGRRLEGLLAPGTTAGSLPEMALGIYHWAVVTDHRVRRSWIVGPAATSSLARSLRLMARGARGRGDPFGVRSAVEADLDEAGYRQAFDRVQHYIHEGDCYQVNLARRFRVRYQGDPLDAYEQLRHASPAPFGAYLSLPEADVLSLSPERFLRVSDGRVETRPIKGTRPRLADPDADAAIIRELASSHKDRAENLMIVDLLRNDLGKGCATGSVEVPELFRVESYATVHHLVSTVTGRLAAGRDLTSLLRDCLPGGSITGAPKHRAMEIIDELEPTPRGVYCGAVGYAGFDGGLDTNIAIRTAVAADGWLEYRAGGGVVADSEEESEYRETEAKAAAFLRLVGA